MTHSHLRVGHGRDIHALFPGHVLVLGGVEVSREVGFDTHSDGDVLCHALIDAMAGAMADGDLGTHFPEDDESAQDARSLEFVAQFGRYARERGYRIVNIDAFITLGTIRLGPYLQTMRQLLAEALDLDVARISVKARSADGLGVC